MDGVPEPLIAWGLYESLSGDFIGNLMKILGQTPSTQPQAAQKGSSQESPIMNQLREQHSNHPYREESHVRNGNRPVTEIPQFLKNQNQERSERRKQ